MDECTSRDSESLLNGTMEDNNGNKSQTGTSVNNNISASGGNWTQVNQAEKKDQPANPNLAENDANEIEDLLSLTVSKDYINCVWTSVPDGDTHHAGVHEGSVTADLTPNNCESSNGSENLCPNQVLEKNHESTRSPVIIRRKRKRTSKKNSQEKEEADKQVLPILETPETSNSDVPTEPAVNKQTKQKTKPEANKISFEKINSDLPKPKECSENMDKLFSAYKHFVTNQPVPLYNACVLNNRFPSQNFFTCKACGDKFVLETSLLGHMSRKIGRLLYKCPVCDDRLCFDNRCAFLNHLKSHRFEPDFLKPGDLSVLPLEGDESECALLFKNTSLNLSMCPECSQMVESIQLHFEGGNTVGSTEENISDILICDLCGYVSPSKCAASAHDRFHECILPFICPDCGETCLNSSSLLSHMKKNCLHDLKRTVFKCSLCCDLVIQSIDEYFDHLITKHVRSVFKCHICGNSEASFDDFNSHRVAEHKLQKINLTSAAADSATVTECDICPGAVITLASVEDHASVHTFHRNNMLTVFQCTQCQSRFASKTLMLDHIPSCGSSEDSACKRSIVDGAWSEPFESTYTKQTKTPLVPSERTPTSKRIRVKKVYQMEHLERTPINDTMSEEIIEDDIKVGTLLPPTNAHPLKKSVVCKICRKVLSAGPDKVLIKRHFSSDHFDIYMNAIHREVNGQQTTAAENYVMKTDQEIVDSFLKSFTNKDIDPKIRLKKQNVKKIKTKITKANAAGRVGLKAQKSGPVKTAKKCYKCSFTSKDLRSFRTHIISHRSNASELQCPECGLCFIVRPPLEKHLIAVHGIKNVGKYLSDNGFVEHESEVELTDNEDQIINVESDTEVLQENQCKVCKKIFESAMLLEKHFRVHGGAFLLANLKAKRSSL